jgi:glucose/arabinose dehydrogenase
MRYSSQQLTLGGVTWTLGDLFADGLRNEVALAFDSLSRLWGVENGVDDVARSDLTGPEALYINNPAEEVNLLGSLNTSIFYGYPYCWSEGPDATFDAKIAPGTQWYDSRAVAPKTDSWCRLEANVVAPKFVL